MVKKMRAEVTGDENIAARVLSAASVLNPSQDAASLNAAPANPRSGLVGRLGLRRRRSPAKDPHPHPPGRRPRTAGRASQSLTMR